MHRQLIPVLMKQVWMALDAGHVQEVLSSRAWLPIPGANSEVPGVLSWRGRAIAVVDLGLLAGVAEPLAPGETRERTLVIQHGPYTMAVMVDGVREVADVHEEALRPIHAARQRFAQHEIDLNGAPMAVLDVPSVVSSVSGAEAK
jgi:chemotaxis signal transduction protein